jgi:hypothetical protein
VFYFCRPVALDHERIGLDWPTNGNFKLERDLERWWYKVAQVCQRWRYLVLASPSYLKLSLLCTNGVPLTDMLAHSPPLPLVINYVVEYRFEYRNRHPLTAKDGEAILLALQHRDRVRRIHLQIPIAKLQRAVWAMRDHFPILEHLYIAQHIIKHEMVLMLPRTFQAPQLRHLILQSVIYPTGSLLLATPAGLVNLSLKNIVPSTYFHPSDLLPWLALMPQLETLGIGFRSRVLDPNTERQLLHSPTLTPLTLPNLRWFEFQGVSAYLEALLARLIAPLLQRLKISFFQLNYTVPHLLQFMSTAENLKFSSARVIFKKEAVVVTALPRKGDWLYDASKLVVHCDLLSSQVNSTTRLFNALHQVFSPVEHLTLDHDGHFPQLDEVIPTQWRELLRLFPNVKNLAVKNGLELLGELSRSLLMDGIEPPLGLLPDLNELRIFGGGDTGDRFKPFINARQVSGHPIRLVVPGSERSTDDPIHAHASSYIHHDYDSRQ